MSYSNKNDWNNKNEVELQLTEYVNKNQKANKKLQLNYWGELKAAIEIFERSDNTSLKLKIKQDIIQFLQINFPKDFNIQEIADNVKVHRNTASTYVKVLVAEGKVKLTRTMGKINLYSLSREKSKKKN